MSETLDRQQRWKQQRDDADRQRIDGAYIQGFMETAAALVEEEPLFSKGYWRCAKGCRPFGMGLARTPRECPYCHSQLVNWIDTTPFYGWGKAEEIVGKAVKDRREEVYIFTKCGTIPDGKGGSTENLKPDTIEREVEASLGRLQTDYIDLLQFHDADPTTPVEDSWRALQELIRVGKVRYGGLSNHTVDLIERAMKVGPVTSNQVQYNPLQRKIEKDILPFSQRNSIGVLGWGSLAEGFLTDNFSVGKLDPKDFRRNHWYAQPENQAKVARVRETLARIARAHNRQMVDVVVAWELTHPALTGAIIGIRSEKEA